MNVIADSRQLAELCDRLAAVSSFVTVDTEFMRDNTFWPQLCLVQVAGAEEAAAIDPLAPGLDLAPFYALLANPKVLKVFHAARQDVEIFHYLSGAIPAPIFDTQVAAMVCGFGDSVGYETLVSRLANAQIDKTSRFTDWSKRPLTERQLRYAMADVIHLRVIYEKLAEQLAKTGRSSWLDEEMAVLTDPATYRLDPANAWQRLKPRSSNPRFLGTLRELAAWRETEAQRRNLPRNRILRDEALMEIAAHAPRTAEELARTRGLGKSIAEGRTGAELLAVVARARALPDSDLPEPPARQELPRGLGPLVELLRVLLRLNCESHDVAQRLVASGSDLEMIAADDNAPVAALHGWRRTVFGADALALKHGEIALTAAGKRVKIVTLPERGRGKG